VSARRVSLLEAVRAGVAVAYLASAAAHAHTAELPLPQRADAAFQHQNWAEAAALYGQLTAAEKARNIYWMRLGTSLRHLGRAREALDAYQQAEKAGAPAIFAEYEVALSKGQLHDRVGALDSLTKAINGGRGRPDLLLSEPAFADLHSEPRFLELVEKARENQTPCEHHPQNRQFDFWIGDWDVVRTEEHTTAGVSHIERTLASCVIWENWKSAGDSGYEGKSYNTYNADLKRWEQFWVDNQSGMMHFTGSLLDGIMDFRTEGIPQPDGKTLYRHLRFFPIDGNTVRQLSEGSTDGGKTWQVEYDLTYQRRRRLYARAAFFSGFSMNRLSGSGRYLPNGPISTKPAER
jgi:tetratricopeptide (TPR) repeat protein